MNPLHLCAALALVLEYLDQLVGGAGIRAAASVLQCQRHQRRTAQLPMEAQWHADSGCHVVDFDDYIYAGGRLIATEEPTTTSLSPPSTAASSSPAPKRWFWNLKALPTLDGANAS